MAAADARGGDTVTQFNDSELTAEVVRSFEQTPDRRLHFLVDAPGYEPLVTDVFVDGDKYLDSDAVFGVKDELIAKVERHDEPDMPDGKPANGPWHVMTYDFHMNRGSGRAPKPLDAATE